MNLALIILGNIVAIELLLFIFTKVVKWIKKSWSDESYDDYEDAEYADRDE